MTTTFIESLEAFLEENISRADLEKIAAEENITNLDQEIEWYQDSFSAIQATGLRNQLKEVLPAPAKQEVKVVRLKSRNRWVIGIAASLLVIVVVYFGILQSSNNDLYAKHEYIDPGLPVLMSQSDNFSLYDAMTYFGEGDYVTAEEKLRQLQTERTTNDTITYYLAASQLYQGKTDLDQSALQQLANDSNSNYHQKAEWLLVLTALKNKNEAEVQRLIQPILVDTEHDFHERALALQKDLSQ